MSEDLRLCVERQQKLNGDLVVPLLAFPGYSSDKQPLSFIFQHGRPENVYARCRELRDSGYDSVVGLPFENASAYLTARKQIEMLRPEVLSFAHHLEEVEIVQHDGQLTRWRHDSSRDGTSRVYLGHSDADYREWKVYPKRGAVSRDLLPVDQPHGADYEIVIAVPTNHKAEARVLYSYFPTEVPFPFPAVCHVSLDLQANRQPQNTPANHFIVGELAEFMAATAEKLSAQVSDEAGLRLIGGERFHVEALEKFSFGSRLLAAAKRRAIVPTLSRGLVTPADARRVNFTDTSWLPTGRLRPGGKAPRRPILAYHNRSTRCAPPWALIGVWPQPRSISTHWKSAQALSLVSFGIKLLMPLWTGC